MIEIRMTRLKALLIAKGMTHGEAAKSAQVSRCNLTTLMNGHHKPSGEVAELVAGAVGWDGDPLELFDEITLKEE